MHFDIFEFGQVNDDYRNLLSQESGWTLSWIRKQANLIAHPFNGVAILHASALFSFSDCGEGSVFVMMWDHYYWLILSSFDFYWF